MFTLLTLFSRLTRRQPNYFLATQEFTSGGAGGFFEPLSPKLLRAIGLCIPELSYDKHKGQAGRVGIVGGSDEYTGAPHYAGISALRCGADLATIICTPSAAGPIKSYCPEHIVLPYLFGEDALKNIIPILPRLHSVVVGPGLGRDERQLNLTEKVISEIKERGLPLVIDADGLFLVTQKPEIVKGYRKTILTPNAAEFERLYIAVMQKSPTEDEPIMDVKQLAKKLRVTILRKGPVDIVSDGAATLVVSTETSPRRCGGQGDLLAGLLGVFSHWMQQAELQPHIREEKHMSLYGPTLLASVAASAMTRECNRLAFKKFGRSMLVTDMIAQIGHVFTEIFHNTPEVENL